jgi:hypothetical protein
MQHPLANCFPNYFNILALEFFMLMMYHIQVKITWPIGNMNLWAFDVWGVMLVATLAANAQHLHALAAPFIQV